MSLDEIKRQRNVVRHLQTILRWVKEEQKFNAWYAKEQQKVAAQLKEAKDKLEFMEKKAQALATICHSLQELDLNEKVTYN